MGAEGSKKNNRPTPGERWVTIGEKGLVKGKRVAYVPSRFIHTGYVVEDILDSGMVRTLNKNISNVLEYSYFSTVEPANLYTSSEIKKMRKQSRFNTR